MGTQPTTIARCTRPVHDVRLGSIRASIWANDTESGTCDNVTFDHSYRDGEVWKLTCLLRTRRPSRPREGSGPWPTRGSLASRRNSRTALLDHATFPVPAVGRGEFVDGPATSPRLPGSATRRSEILEQLEFPSQSTGAPVSAGGRRQCKGGRPARLHSRSCSASATAPRRRQITGVYTRRAPPTSIRGWGDVCRSPFEYWRRIRGAIVVATGTLDRPGSL